jgi:hypothetical protein
VEGVRTGQIWVVERMHRLRVSRGGVILGAVDQALAIAVFVALFATVIFLIGAFSGDSTFNLYNWSVLVLAYVAAGLLGGILVGLLRPITPYPLGRMLIGIPVAILVYGFIGIAMLVTGIGDGPETFREGLVIGIGIGVIAGPMGALTFHGGVWADELKYPRLTARTGAL